MKTLFNELLTELASTPDHELEKCASNVRSRVRKLAKSDQTRLVQEAIARSRSASAAESGWIPERTLTGLILDAAGVSTVSSLEQHALRQQIASTPGDGVSLELAPDPPEAVDAH